MSDASKMTPEEMLARIASLEDANSTLEESMAAKNKRSAAAANALPNMPSYDPGVFATAENIAERLSTDRIMAEAKVTDARNFIKLFQLVAMAQTKPTGLKGRGKLLYLNGNVTRALRTVSSFLNL